MYHLQEVSGKSVLKVNGKLQATFRVENSGNIWKGSLVYLDGMFSDGNWESVILQNPSLIPVSVYQFLVFFFCKQLSCVVVLDVTVFWVQSGAHQTLAQKKQETCSCSDWCQWSQRKIKQCSQSKRSRRVFSFREVKVNTFGGVSPASNVARSGLTVDPQNLYQIKAY